MSQSIKGDASWCGAFGITGPQPLHIPNNTTKSEPNKWMVLKCIPLRRDSELGGINSLHLGMYVYASLFVHSNTSTSQAGAWESVGPLSRQNHIRNQNDRIDRGRKERKERKQLSIAVGWREKDGECGRREKLNSGRVGVGERVNACVVALLCPAPEWSVSKLSSNW